MVSAARRRIVYNSIKSSIIKGQEVEYWAMKMYEQQDAGVLTDQQVSELEVLIEEYYEKQEANSEPAIVEPVEEEPVEPEPEQTEAE